MATRTGPTAFLSYRGEIYQYVAPVRQWLRSTGLAGDAIFMRPEELALDHELMLPFEMFELMLAIWQRMEKCGAFVYINSQGYLSSIWTTLEVTGWRFLASTANGYAIGSGQQGYVAEPVSFHPMPSGEKRLWRQLRVHLEPMGVAKKSHLMIPNRGGRYATSYYLLPCRVCGEYSLLPKKAVESLAKKSGVIRCAQPACQADHRLKRTGRFNAMRYRVPIVAVPLSSRRAPSLRPLTVEEIMHLYSNGKQPPPAIAVRLR